MSLLKYPLLVSDIDGTLVNNMKEIPRVNRESIEAFRRNGGLFTLATGRSYPESRRFIEQLNIDLPVILCNGAILYEPDTRNLHPVATLERDLVFYALEEIRRVSPSIDVFVYSVDTVYATEISPLAEAGLESDDFQLEIVPSFEQLPQTPWVKVVAVADKNAMPELHRWSQTVRQPLEFVQSSAHYFEIMPPHVSKGAGLEYVAQRYDLSPKQASAIGDHLNDLSMIRIAGLSAAVGNAHPHLIQAADVVTPTNEEGAVAHLIRNHLMEMTPRVAGES